MSVRLRCFKKKKHYTERIRAEAARRPLQLCLSLCLYLFTSKQTGLLQFYRVHSMPTPLWMGSCISETPESPRWGFSPPGRSRSDASLNPLNDFAELKKKSAPPLISLGLDHCNNCVFIFYFFPEAAIVSSARPLASSDRSKLAFSHYCSFY